VDCYWGCWQHSYCACLPSCARRYAGYPLLLQAIALPGDDGSDGAAPAGQQQQAQQQQQQQHFLSEEAAPQLQVRLPVSSALCSR
jgi:hypothetical protein